MIQFSPNGKYLVSVDDERRVIVWKVNDNKIENSEIIRHYLIKIESDSNSKELLVDIQWGYEVNDNCLLLLSNEDFGLIDNVIDTSSSKNLLPAKIYTTNEIQEIENKTNDINSIKNTQNHSQLLINNNVEKSNNKRLSKSKVSFSGNDEDDDELVFESSIAEVDTETVNITSIKNISNKNRIVDDLDDDNIIDDEIDNENDEMIIEDTNFYSSKFSSPSTITLQPAFQPSSTIPDEKKRRFMVWNNVGNIT